jgi:uncharacterized Tic20 family protein
MIRPFAVLTLPYSIVYGGQSAPPKIAGVFQNIVRIHDRLHELAICDKGFTPMTQICSAIFLIGLLSIGIRLIWGGAKALSQRQVTYLKVTKSGRNTVKYHGKAAVYVGVSQIFVGLSLSVAVIGAFIDVQTLITIGGVTFCISLPLLGGVVAVLNHIAPDGDARVD